MKGLLSSRDGDFLIEIGLQKSELFTIFNEKIFADIMDDNGEKIGQIVLMSEDLFPGIKNPS